MHAWMQWGEEKVNLPEAMATPASHLIASSRDFLDDRSTTRTVLELPGCHISPELLLIFDPPLIGLGASRRLAWLAGVCALKTA